MQKVDSIKRRAVWKHVRGDGGAEGVRSSAEWWEQSWQDRVGDVRDDGASGRSGSLRQKVKGLGVVERQWESVMCSAGGGVLVEMEET